MDHFRQGRPASAKYAEAQALYQQAGAAQKHAQVTLKGARADLQLGRNVDVGETLDVASQSFAHLGDAAAAAQVLVLRGDLERLQGRLEAARAAYTSAAEALPPDAAAEALAKRAQVESHLRGDPAAAVAGRSAPAGLPFGRVLAALDRGDAARMLGNSDAATAAYAEASALWEAMTDPVAAANRLLGLPPVSTLTINPPELPPLPVGLAADEPEAVRDAEDLRGSILRVHISSLRTNLARFPDHNAEASALVEATQQRLQ